MKSWIVCYVAAVVGLICISAPAQAQDEVMQLLPSSGWLLDYEDDSCALRRSFGGDGQTVILEIRQFSPEGLTQFSIYSADIGTDGDEIAFGYLPGAGAQQLEGGYFVDYGPAGAGVTFTGRLGPPELDDEGSGDWPLPTDPEILAFEGSFLGFAVGAGFDRDFVMQTGPLGAAMGAIRSCMDELLTHWGIDAEAHKTLQRRVTSEDRQLLARRVARVYPTDMIRQSQSGLLILRIMISAEGEPTSCSVQAGIADDSFRDAACQQIRRHGRFLPALDANGNAIDSYWSVSVQYTI